MQNGSQMSIGDWIQVIAIVTSLIVSLVSIIQTQKSLKITRETIESENRPYLSFYIEYQGNSFNSLLLLIPIFLYI